MYELYVPYPPTVNSYYVKTQRGVYISAKGKAFRASVAESVNEQLPDVNITHRCIIEVVLYPPDFRKRDIDNCLKALLDAFTKCGLWTDDVLIDQIYLYRGVTVKPIGITFVRIGQAGPLIPKGFTDF